MADDGIGDKAKRYRQLATQTRERAIALSNDPLSRHMLEAADVWDRLADIAEGQVEHPVL